MKVITIIGASATGKSFLSQAYHQKYSSIPYYQFDTIGVPSYEDMIKEYGSGEEWQLQKTIEWMNRIVSENKSAEWVLFEGQTRPQFVNEAYEIANLKESFIVCLWCDAQTMQKRLQQRKQPELFSDDMINWCNLLRKWSEESSNAIVLDTSGDESDQNIEKLCTTINDIMIGTQKCTKL